MGDVLPAGDAGAAADGVRLVPLSDQDAHRSIGLAWHRDQTASPAGRRVRAFAAEQRHIRADPTPSHAEAVTAATASSSTADAVDTRRALRGLLASEPPARPASSATTP